MIRQINLPKIMTSRFRSYVTKPLTSYLPTIYALSTPAGQKSAIAIIRITGTHTTHIYKKLTGLSQLPKPRKALLRKLYNPHEKNNLLDSSIALYFKSPHSFTGEDMLELHIHGGKAISNSVIKAIESIHDRNNGINIRYAEAGEFSKRAFQNSKFDLTEIEGIRDLIDAETESQRRSVLSSFNGENKRLFHKWRKELIECSSKLTAIIDFGDDNDLNHSDVLFDQVEKSIINLQTDIVHFIKRVEQSTILQDGIKLVLVGAPNVGKSSILNNITKVDTSIVSDIPGTTRDTVDAVIDINGYKVILCDTAGIRRGSTDKIEQIGIERAKAKLLQADICILVVDPTQQQLFDTELINLLKGSDLKNKHILIVVNKTDLVHDVKSISVTLNEFLENNKGIIPVSCKSGVGIDYLLHQLTKEFRSLASNGHFEAINISQRVKDILNNDILHGINEFIEVKRETGDVLMAAENLQYAIDGIGKITGEAVGIEEVLGLVFSKFCVGK